MWHLLSPAPTGSHNAITYCLDMNDRSPVDLTQPDMLQKLDKYMKPLIRPYVYKWAITQVRRASGRRRLFLSGWKFNDLNWIPLVTGVHYKAAAGLRHPILRPEDRAPAQRQLHRPLLLPRRVHYADCGGRPGCSEPQIAPSVCVIYGAGLFLCK